MQFNNKAILTYCNIAIKKYYKWASLSLNPALGFAECRHHLGITIEQARGFCSRLALPLQFNNDAIKLPTQKRYDHVSNNTERDTKPDAYGAMG